MNINKNSNKLEDRANDFYKKKMFLEAKLSYDALISIDSAKGEYYYKRGNCESMISDSKIDAILDFFKAINHNYSEKQKAYLNIGTIHRFNAVFRCKTDHDRIAEYDTALYFYNESLKVEHNYAKALKEKEEVIENLKRISFQFPLYNQLAYFRFSFVVNNNNYINPFISAAVISTSITTIITTRKG